MAVLSQMSELSGTLSQTTSDDSQWPERDIVVKVLSAERSPGSRPTHTAHTYILSVESVCEVCLAPAPRRAKVQLQGPNPQTAVDN